MGRGVLEDRGSGDVEHDAVGDLEVDRLVVDGEDGAEDPAVGDDLVAHLEPGEVVLAGEAAAPLGQHDEEEERRQDEGEEDDRDGHDIPRAAVAGDGC